MGGRESRMEIIASRWPVDVQHFTSCVKSWQKSALHGGGVKGATGKTTNSDDGFLKWSGVELSWMIVFEKFGVHAILCECLGQHGREPEGVESGSWLPRALE